MTIDKHHVKAVGATATRFLGGTLRAGIAIVLSVRHPRPIHSRGAVLDGWVHPRPSRLVAVAGAKASPSAVRIVARLSRSIGLPDALPDVYGLALRGVIDGRTVDLQLSATGVGVPGRFLLAPHLTPDRATYSSILPVRTKRGPMLFCARTIQTPGLPVGLPAIRRAVRREPWRLGLYAATPRGRWHPIGEIVLDAARPEDEPTLRFDVDRHPMPGTEPYGWVAALRQPAYRLAQGRDPGERADEREGVADAGNAEGPR